MPIFQQAGPEARERLARVSKGFQLRQVYRDHLSQLTDGNKLWEIRPEEGENLRRLKVNVRRAANELNLDARYGETNEGTLLVWREEGRARKRGRPRKMVGEAAI